MGGESALEDLSARLGSEEGSLAGVMGLLDRDGDGNALNDIAGMASSFFGRK